MAASGEFWARIWGVRGSVPVPGPTTLRYGGNTACLEVMCGTQRLIFDAGTGIRLLGERLCHVGMRRAHLFLTHTHHDHVNGFPFFKPAYRADHEIIVWAGHLGARGLKLKDTLASIMASPFFPISLDILRAKMTYNDFAAGDDIEPCAGLKLRTAPLNHPGGATAYRVDFAGKSICYVTDTEHTPGELDDSIVGLIRGADLVIYDSHFLEDEIDSFKGWGHSTWRQGVRLCEAADAGRLVTFHHEPNRTDAELDVIGEQLAKARPGSLVGREGLILRP
ncbi:MAG: MBL fold metallo-hydrolase [Geminicoccaceae bacterium]